MRLVDTFVDNCFLKNPVPDLLLTDLSCLPTSTQGLHHMDNSAQEMHAGIEVPAEQFPRMFHLLASSTNAFARGAEMKATVHMAAAIAKLAMPSQPTNEYRLQVFSIVPR